MISSGWAFDPNGGYARVPQDKTSQEESLTGIMVR